MDETAQGIQWWHVALPCLCFLLCWLGTVAARAEFRRTVRQLLLDQQDHP